MIESFNNSQIQVANSEQQLDGEQRLTDIEKHKLLVEWNNTARDYPQDKCIHELFEATVERTPLSVAVVFEGKQLTYRELNARANQVAHYLQGLGVGPEVLVGICVERSLEMVVGVLGILKAGGAYVPLDPAYPSERLTFMLEDTQTSVLLTQARLVESLPPHSSRVVCLDTDWEVIARHSHSNPQRRVTTNNLAYVIYTSGSTGRPKGVAMSHRPLCNLLFWQLESSTVSTGAKTLQFAPLSFDVSFQEIFSTWCSGGTLVLISEELRRDAVGLLHFLSEKAIERLFLPFVALQLLAEVADGQQAVPTSLHEIITAGEQLKITRQIANWFTKLKSCTLHNHYGPSESHVVTAFTLTGSPSDWSALPPIGRPIANTQIYLLSAQLQPVPVGVPGELYIGGIALARGYLNRPDLTDERFIPNPFSDKPGERLYKTGDLACYLPDGNIEFLGRSDHQVKIRGFRIELGEIEAALWQHPSVREAAVMAREDVPGDKRLVAYVVHNPQDQGLQEQAADLQVEQVSLAQKLIPYLRSFLQEKLPDYMVPSVFVMLDALPLTPNGKVDRRALPVPDSGRPDLEENFVAPRTSVEEVLAEIWVQVLGVERVGIHDKFLELGGHSILATQIVSRLRDALQVELPVGSLFTSPTVAELAKCIEAGDWEKQGLQAPPIQPVSRNQNLPLSWGQEQLWFLAQVEPDTPVYNEPCTIRFSGAINVDALEKALNEIIKRHESLRTRFITVDGQPVQAIAPPDTFNLPVMDLRVFPQELREAEALQIATKEAKLLFDLTTGPLLRATLMQLADFDYRLILTFHHIIIDGVSLISVFLKELAALYEAFSTGRPSLRHATLFSCAKRCTPLAPLPIQYADFAVWQRQWLTQEILESQLDYWKQQLADLPVLQLPYDHPRPKKGTFRGARQSLVLSFDLTEALKTLSQQEGVTLYMTLLAAFKTLLYRYTGQDDIVVGTFSANRNRPELEGLIGYFLNTLVLRTDMSGTPSFRELLKRVRQVTLGAYAHEDLPFEKLVQTLQPERNLSQNPLFQVAFAPQPPMPSLNSEWTINQLDIQTDTAKFDLSLDVEERPEGIIGRLEYNTDLFDAKTISRMIGHFQTLLEGIVANPRARVSELPLLTEAERQQLLVEWNNTWAEFPQDKCIHQLFEEQVELSPDAVAVVFEGTQLTYRELNARANQLAHYLLSLGVGSEVLVGICVERSLEMIVGLLGILKAGGAYVPLDPAYPLERLAFMLEDSAVPVLLTQQRLIGKLPHYEAEVLCLDTQWEIIAQYSSQNSACGVNAENLAYVIYTSGSTGKPKGVTIQHRSLVNYTTAVSIEYEIEKCDRILQFSSISFDVSAEEIYTCLTSGATLVLRTDSMLDSVGVFWQKCRDLKITVLALPTAYWHELTAILSQETFALPPSLRLVIIGGEKALPERLKTWIECVGQRVRLVNNYGPTEATVGATIYDCSTANPASTEVPIGRPILNVQTYILDRYQQPVPIGVRGELHIGGDGLARGYLNHPDLTQEKFIPNSLGNEPGSRLYKTGDKARYLPDGNIEYLGRIDNQVKIRGFRIELGEIETAISQHPSVKETVVIATENNTGNKQLVAYIALQTEVAPSISDLRYFLKQKLPDYMIPAAFVMLDNLPLTPNGKVDRCALPSPELRPELELTFVAPRTPIEEILASIFACVLGIEQVGVHNNFFELGGHSLLATQVISRVRDTLAVELPLRSLFEAPTVATLAKQVENSLHSGQSIQAQPLLPIPRSGDIPLSFAQARLWFLDQLQPNSAFYNIPLALRLSGQLNIEALQSSINAIIQRHEALRTNFATQEGQPVQIIASTLNCQLQVVNLLHLPESDRGIEAQRLVNEQANRPFNLEREPLLRGTVLQLGETEYVLLLTMHHIISDGWSLGVFVRELTQLYKAFCTGAPPSLPELPVQYADFAVWQRQWLQGEILVPQLDYWKEQLLDAPALLELPTDRPRPAVQTFRGGYYYAALSHELSAELTALSKRAGVTLFMTLFAAFGTLLYRYSGQDDIVVGTPVANRNRREIEGLIGFFVNTLVLRTDLSGNPSFEQLLNRVREVALGAYAHQDLPFEQLVETLQPTRDLSYTPLFQVMFALDDALVPSVELPELAVSSYPVEIGTAKFDLTLSMENTADGLVGEWEYNADLFDEVTIARMAGHFQTLLEAIAADPIQPISELPLLTQRERHQLLVEWNNTTIDYPQDKCIHQLFEEQVALTPDAVALVFEGEQLTYRELNARANQLAHYLRSLGVEPEVLVGICVERSLEMIVGLLGILKAGGAYVPLDPAYPSERLAFMLEDSAVPVLLTQQRLVDKLPQHETQVVCLDTQWEIIARHSEQNIADGVNAENLGYVIYTSGSTGKPKGVTIQHRSLVNYTTAVSIEYEIEKCDCFLQFSSISFDVSAEEIYTSLTSGATLVLRTDSMLDSIGVFLQKCIDWKITVLALPTAYWHELTAFLNKETFVLPPSLRLVIIGGEKALPERLKTWHECVGQRVRLVNNYGPTEATVGATVYDCSAANPASTEVPIGRPIRNVQTYILDRYQQPVPIGVPGELHIGGAGLARGYLNRPDLTQEKFISSPFSKEPGERLYKTGDKARYLPDGNIEYLGRIDNQVKIRGFRIELGEIEAMLAQHPDVREAVVVVRENIPGHKSLVSYLVLHQNPAPTVNQLRHFLKQKLPNYMVPSTFVMLEALPLTPNGKVDHKSLPAPDLNSLLQKSDFVAPGTPTEELVASIWAKVLGVEQVGINDNFFELGGHSLLATQLLSQVSDTCGVELPLSKLFEAPTVASISNYIEAISWASQSLKTSNNTVNNREEVEF